MSERNQVITASRMSTMMRCPRQHYWRYEVGLQSTAVGTALRVGGAWAKATEARWNGKTYEEALAFSLPADVNLDEYTAQTVAALLAGYYDYWGPVENYGKLTPEVEFQIDLGDGFINQGKIDGIGTLRDNRSALIEGKTTGDSLKPDSDYWLRLNFNIQVFNYVDAARSVGWDLGEVIYDVTRKPSIKPKTVDDLDSKGLKIVLDAQGQRVFLAAGKNKGEPRQTGEVSKGYVVKSHVETPDEYADRLYADTKTRPDFYFARREIPVLDMDLEQFRFQRRSITKMIAHFRENESDFKLDMRPENAWPRNVSKDTCNFCQFKNICLQNASVDVHNPPAGYIVASFNPELDKYDTNETSEAGNDGNASA